MNDCDLVFARITCLPTAFETRHRRGSPIQLHRHRAPYAAVVLEGEYFEASADGLWRCAAGAVVIHPPLHVHANRFASSTRVLNIPLAGCADAEWKYGVWQHANPALPEGLDSLVGLELAEVLRSAHKTEAEPMPARIAKLATTITGATCSSVVDAAREMGISREHLSRCFRRHFGMSPRRYGAEHRLRRAATLLRQGTARLSTVALDSGFADHPHFARAVRLALGTTPGALRKELQRY